MPHTPETEVSTGQPNIQDVFLNYARRERLTVTIQLMDGSELEGRIKNFDRFALIVEVRPAPITCSSSTRSPPSSTPRAVSNYFSHSYRRASDVPSFTRAIVIVLDSVGIGELPDARRLRRQGSNTLGNIAAQVPLQPADAARARPRPRRARSAAMPPAATPARRVRPHGRGVGRARTRSPATGR